VIRIPFTPRHADVDAEKIDRIQRRVAENEQRITKLQRRLNVAEIRLGIGDGRDEDNDDDTLA
jgi:hypothetical protein